jgi:hypothetical protein
MHQGNHLRLKTSLAQGNHFHTIETNGSAGEKEWRPCHFGKGGCKCKCRQGCFSNVSTHINITNSLIPTQESVSTVHNTEVFLFKIYAFSPSIFFAKLISFSLILFRSWVISFISTLLYTFVISGW